MKNLFFITAISLLALNAQAQNVGIGISTPLARLHVADSNVLFSATGDIPVTAGLPPLQGGGRRMMWYPGKAAFRVGTVNDVQWDKDSIGDYSFASGNSTKAKGFYSTAMGYYTTASGTVSIAIGYITTASGNASTSMGESTTASGFASTAMGSNTIAAGNYSTAAGYLNTASGWFSTAMGSNSTAKSSYETVLGRWNTDYTPVNTTTGWDMADRLFTIGNGTSSSSRSDALTVLKDGKIGIANSTPAFPLSFATAIGDKISLWSNSSNSYGLGIQSSLLQIHTDISASDIVFGYGSSSTFTETMRIKGNGNVGIGISTPNAPLGFPPALGKKITLYPGATGDVGMAVMGNLFQIYSDNPSADIAFGYDVAGTMTERMRIRGNGNVGIGTSSPGAKLQISAGDASVALFGPNSYGGMLYIGASPTNYSTALTAQVLASDGNLHIDPASGKNIYVGYYQARDIYLDPFGGNVGIGTTTPVNILDVTGNSGSAGNFVNTSTLLNSTGVFGSCYVNANNGYGILGQGGKVGVFGQASLSGTGDRFGLLGFGNNGTGTNYGVYGSATGGATAYGVYGIASGAITNFAGYFVGNVFCFGGTYQGSDRKLKKDIKGLSDALSIIEQLKPSVYSYKTDEYKQMHLPEGLQYGLIADEVQQVVPGAVKKVVQPAEYENHDEKKGKKLSDEVEFNAVNYTELIPVLIGAVKEQQVIINNQQKQIDELKKLVEKLLKQ